MHEVIKNYAHTLIKCIKLYDYDETFIEYIYKKNDNKLCLHLIYDLETYEKKLSQEHEEKEFRRMEKEYGYKDGYFSNNEILEEII